MLPDAQNATDIAVVAAFLAQIALFPLTWQADVRERGAEWSFLCGGMLACCHRNDTISAGSSVNAAAVQFVHITLNLLSF